MSPDEIRLTLLAEQRHSLNDLDADSCVPDYPGCVCVACPPNRKRVIMRKLNVWKTVGFVLGFVIGLALIAVVISATDADGATRTTPPCDGRARILCGVKIPGKTVPAVPSQPRRNGPIARG